MPERENASNPEGYDRWSRFYDEYPNPTVAADEMHFPRLWAHVRGKRVLEVGCGTGRHTLKLVAQENHVVGIDASPCMLREARRKLGGAQVELIASDFLAYGGFVPGSFDVIITSLVLEHIADLEAFFRRGANLLIEGGELMISEIHPSRSAAGTLAHFREPGSGREVHLQSYAHTAQQIETAAQRAGLKLTRTQEVAGDDALATLNSRWARHLGLPMIQIWSFVKQGMEAFG